MRSNWKTLALICGLLAIVTAVAYHSAVFCEFVSLDDPEYVYRNPRVMNGLSPSGIWYAWTSFEHSNWHPLTWMSYELDGSFWHEQPMGYHITNVLIHVVDVVLLLLVLYRLTGQMGRSAAVAAIFALHPLHVESVAWVSERKDVLSLFFLLLTIWCYQTYVERPSLLRYFLVVVLFILGLLAKPMLVTLPLLLLLLDYWPLQRFHFANSISKESKDNRWRVFVRLVLEKIPLLFIAFVDGLVTLAAQKHAAKLLGVLPVEVRIANTLNAYCWYVQKTFWPTNLVVFYPHPERNLSWIAIGVGVLLVVSVSLISLVLIRKKPYFAVGWLWFVIALLPVIGLTQVGGQAYADRYSYIPHIGLFILIVWEIHSWIGSTKIGRGVELATLIGTCALFGFMTHQQIQYWRTNETLWTHALQVIPDNGVAHAHMADLRQADADFENAIIHIEQGLQSHYAGDVANGYCNWGVCLLELGRPKEAEAKFQEALQRNRFHQRSLNEMIKLLQSQGRTAEIAPYASRLSTIIIRQAEQQPDNPAAQQLLGIEYAKQGRINQALSHFQQAVKLSPRSAEARVNLGLLQVQANHLAEAKRNLNAALEINPELGSAHYVLASIFEREGQLAAAKEHVETALRIDPTDRNAQQLLERLSQPQKP